VEPGQISFEDGVQVSRTIIGDPTLTSNDAPHNLPRFWAQQSLNRYFYHHKRLQPLLKQKIALISRHCSSMYTTFVGENFQNTATQ